MAKKKETKSESKNEQESTLSRILSIVEANTKAIKELEEKTQKTFLEYSSTLALLKERNRLR
jgi:hypothetical protein